MQEVNVFEAHGSYVLGLRFTRDGRTLISAGMDNVVNLWSAREWQLVNKIEGHDHSVNGFALSPDESKLATGSTDRTVRLWSFPDGRLLHTLQDRKKTVAGIVASEKYVAAASYGGRTAVWTWDGEPVAGIKVSQKNLASVALSPDGRLLAVGGLGPDITIFSLPEGELVTKLTGHKTAVVSLKFTENGRTLVSMGYEQTVRFWDSADWSEKRTISLDPKGVRGVEFSTDEQTAVLSLESRVQLRRVDDWSLLAELPVSTKVVNGMAFSPDGRWLALGAADKKIRIWEVG